MAKKMMSQGAFAQELGVPFTTVNRWESGKTRSSYKTMRLIDHFCKANDIDFDINAKLLESGGNE